MKIAITSDVHLEFGPLILENKDNIDVLILSGDICVANDLKYQTDSLGILSNAKYDRIKEFFTSCSNNFRNVIYVMGNHEHYHGDFAKSADLIRGFLMSNDYSNIHFLDKESVTIDGVHFFGGTLWTDMNNEDPNTLYSIAHRMNDFRIVENSTKQVSFKTMVPLLDESGNVKRDESGQPRYQAEFRTRDASFSPQDSVDDHKEYLAKLNEFLAKIGTEKAVVVGHHAPSRQSTHPRYKKEVLMNGAYSSSLENLILDHPNIKLWTHGHTHEDFDYMIGSTRIFCNPRGYDGYEERADRFELKTVEI